MGVIILKYLAAILIDRKEKDDGQGHLPDYETVCSTLAEIEPEGSRKVFIETR